MIVVCSVKLSMLIKKSLETMLDGSEQGIIGFFEESMQLQSVDSLAVCMCMFKFLKKRFFKYNVNKQSEVRFQVRPLYNFVKKFNSAAFSFNYKNGSLWIQVVSSFQKTDSNKNVYRILETQDKTRYYTIPPEIFQNTPCFKLDPEEFTNTVLDLAVGGGYIEVEMNRTEVYWRTFFETGSICIKACNHNGQRNEYKVIVPSKEKIYNSYLTKFFKQACNIATICTNLTIYVTKHGPILLYFEMENESTELIISIAPVINI